MIVCVDRIRFQVSRAQQIIWSLVSLAPPGLVCTHCTALHTGLSLKDLHIVPASLCSAFGKQKTALNGGFYSRPTDSGDECTVYYHLLHS